MIKYLSILILICGISCRDNKSVIRDYVTIKIYPYEHENKMKASAMPELKADSELMMYSRRFEYLLIIFRKYTFLVNLKKGMKYLIYILIL
jgi:hypothetical protein